MNLSDESRPCVNLDKVKVFYNEHVMPRPVIVKGSRLEVLQEYVYIGQKGQIGRNYFEEETNRRIHWLCFQVIKIQKKDSL